MTEEEELCEAPLASRDGICDRKASHPDGRCGYHTEGSSMEEDWKPNYKHGTYMDRGGYYEALPDTDQQWIDAIVDDLIDKSYYETVDLSILEKLRQVAIDLHQRRRADEQIADSLTQTNTVGYHEEYGPIEQEVEHTLMITKDRLSRESRMTMKDAGIWDKEHAQSEKEVKSILERMSDEE